MTLSDVSLDCYSYKLIQFLFFELPDRFLSFSKGSCLDFFRGEFGSSSSSYS